MYQVSEQGVDERMINVHYYYYKSVKCSIWHSTCRFPSHEIQVRRAKVVLLK